MGGSGVLLEWLVVRAVLTFRLEHTDITVFCGDNKTFLILKRTSTLALGFRFGFFLLFSPHIPPDAGCIVEGLYIKDSSTPVTDVIRARVKV